MTEPGAGELSADLVDVARQVLDAACLPQGRHTALAAAAVGFGSPLLFYMYVSPGFAHETSAFSVSAFVLVWIVVRRRWTTPRLVALGALAGLMAMVREQDAFVIVGPALDFAWSVLHERRWRAVGPALAGAAAAAVVYRPQAAAYLVLNGRLGPSRLVSRKMTWTWPHAASVLFSPEHALVFWTPLALLAAAGLVLLAPLLAAVAIAVRLDSPGPVLFRQERDGRHGRPFRIHKFRTMFYQAYIRAYLSSQ